MTEYFDKYKPEVRTFGMLSKLEESQKYLMEHQHLVCDHLASFLIVWCVDLQVEGVSRLLLPSFFRSTSLWSALPTKQSSRSSLSSLPRA